MAYETASPFHNHKTAWRVLVLLAVLATLALGAAPAAAIPPGQQRTVTFPLPADDDKPGGSDDKELFEQVGACRVARSSASLQVHTAQGVAQVGSAAYNVTEFARTSNGIGIIIPQGWLLEGENEINYTWVGTRRLFRRPLHKTDTGVWINDWPCSLDGSITITTQFPRRSGVSKAIADYVPQHDGDDVLEPFEDRKYETAPNAWAADPDTAPHMDPNLTPRGCRMIVSPITSDPRLSGFGATQCYDSNGIAAYESNTGVDVDSLPACPVDSDDLTERCVARN